MVTTTPATTPIGNPKSPGTGGVGQRVMLMVTSHPTGRPGDGFLMCP
jgi:hypothetical protein